MYTITTADIEHLKLNIYIEREPHDNLMAKKNCVKAQ